MSLLKASRVSGALTKLSASVPPIPGLTGANGTAPVLPSRPAGTEGRLQQTALVKNKLRKMEASRAYGPRIDKVQL